VTTETIAELVTRRDQLKINIDSDQQRDELAQIVGAITTLLHEPYAREAVRLREMRQEIAQELTQAQHERTRLRSAQEHAQGHRSAALAAGDDPAEHTSSSRRLSVELHDIETRIGELAHRVRGLDSQLVALIEIESASIRSGVSAA
jgi:hypothetical protein